MKKNFIVKVMTLVMAATMALTPVTASAAEKNVVTKAEFDDANYSFFNEEEREFDNKGWAKYVASLDGCYQENGNKIYTALNGKTVTFKKTGNYQPRKMKVLLNLLHQRLVHTNLLLPLKTMSLVDRSSLISTMLEKITFCHLK